MEARDIVQKMMEKDFFSQWLGIEILEIKKGFCKLKMNIRKEMLNGFGIAHGGISYSLADSCLAFAANSNGKHSLSVETSISHVQKAKEGDVLFATAEELNRSNKIGLYQIKITNQEERAIAFFKGTVYQTNTNWE